MKLADPDEIKESLEKYIEHSSPSLKLEDNERKRSVKYLITNLDEIFNNYPEYIVKGDLNFQLEIYTKNGNGGECNSGWIAYSCEGKFKSKLIFKDNVCQVIEYEEFLNASN